MFSMPPQRIKMKQIYRLTILLKVETDKGRFIIFD